VTNIGCGGSCIFGKFVHLWSWRYQDYSLLGRVAIYLGR